ncbi:MAG TPA: hypothetical protein VLY45_04720 [Nitrospiria bacterium]|nr:hypothetical protein [Nitrospiria bacterium]
MVLKPMQYRGTWGLCAMVLSLCGCGTLPNGHGWGEDATLWPGFHQLGHAALQAAVDPVTWVPTAGAMVFAVDHFDKRVSNWVSEHTPIFGSQSTAGRTSTILMDVTCGGTVVTALAAPSGPEPEDWTLNKLKGGGIELGAGAAAGGVTSLLKLAVGRERPDGSNNNSFPSGHSTGAFACAALGGQNVRTLSRSPKAVSTPCAAAFSCWQPAPPGPGSKPNDTTPPTCWPGRRSAISSPVSSMMRFSGWICALRLRSMSWSHRAGMASSRG